MDRLTLLRTGRVDAPATDPPAVVFFAVAFVAIGFSLGVAAWICWSSLFYCSPIP